MNLARALKLARRVTGMKQFQLARAMGYSESRCSILETDRRLITIDIEVRLAESFGMSVEMYEFLGMNAAERAEMPRAQRERLLRAVGEALVEAADTN